MKTENLLKVILMDGQAFYTYETKFKTSFLEFVCAKSGVTHQFRFMEIDSVRKA